MPAPPYSVPAELPGTPYRLEQLLGCGGFGAVYRASDPRLQHLPLAIKFCLDPERIAALHRERLHLERLLASSGEEGARHIVRLYGYDLDHATPFLVYEYVPGGDLLRRLGEQGQGLGPERVLDWIRQIATGLALAHRHRLVHRDLKPANILLDGDTLKLADFGLGGIGVGTEGQLRTVSQFRGAGTPLYMSPEQRNGEPPDPRHDLYSLGVLWYQLLLGDTNAEMNPGWERELAALGGVPRLHVELIGRCVALLDERPADADQLLTQLPGQAAAASASAAPGVRRCPNCGAGAMPHERTCKRCYARLHTQAEAPRLDAAAVCPACRRPFPTQNVVCLGCGYDRRTWTSTNPPAPVEEEPDLELEPSWLMWFWQGVRQSVPRIVAAVAGFLVFVDLIRVLNGGKVAMMYLAMPVLGVALGTMVLEGRAQHGWNRVGYGVVAVLFLLALGIVGFGMAWLLDGGRGGLAVVFLFLLPLLVYFYRKMR